MKPFIPVLHVEDEEEAEFLSKELVERQIYSYNVDNLKDALEIIDKIDFSIIVSDGMFPSSKGKKIEKNFIPLMNEIKKRKKKILVIPWANSTHVHEYAKKNNLISYSKKEMTPEMFAEKGRNYVNVEKVDAKKMADIISEKLIELNDIQNMVKGKIESFYSEPGTVLAISMAGDARTYHFKKTIGENYGAWICEINKGMFEVYSDSSTDEKISDIIFKKIIEEGFFPEIDKGVMDNSIKLLEFTRPLKQMNFSLLTNKQLSELYEKFYYNFIGMRIYSSLPTALEQTNKWTKMLKEIIEKRINDESERNKALSLLTTPEKISYVKQFDIELAQTKLKGSNSKDIEDITDKYTWINYAFEGVPITKKDVIARLNEISLEDAKNMLKEYENEKKEIPKKKEQMFKKYKFTEEERKFFDYGAEIVFIKFYRKGVFAESYYCVEFLLREIARRIKVTEKQVKNMLPREVMAALITGCFPTRIVDKRLEHSILVLKEGNSKCFEYGIKKYFEKYIEKEKLPDEIKGQVAYPGKAKGIAVHVNSMDDLKRFKEGNILISRSTNPSLVPAMKLAAAIVTDIGGLTCHAAIIARELKKPCVIGTKTGTKSIKEGELIEVDADKGIVRKI